MFKIENYRIFVQFFLEKYLMVVTVICFSFPVLPKVIKQQLKELIYNAMEYEKKIYISL